MLKNAIVCLTAFFLFAIVVLAQSPYSVAGALPDPVVFAPGVVSTGDYESHPAFTPDGKTLYFLKDSPDANFWIIVVTHFADGKWSIPVVAPFSGKYADADPFITADGSRFFFVSNRAADGKVKEDTDIWMMQKTGDSWSDPVRLPDPVNSSGNEWYPTVANDGTLYFGSNRPGGQRNDIYRCKFTDGKFQPPENVGAPINSEADEYEPFIAPDQSYMLLMARRPDSIGGFDLYVSHQEKGNWTPPRNLGKAINTPGDEYSPKISPDGRYFFYTSPRNSTFSAGVLPARATYDQLLERLHAPGNGLGDIYRMDANSVLKK